MIKLIAGVDEVGRGCLAGPVVAASVILKRPIYGLNDSKKISKSKRKDLASEIKKNSVYAICEVSPKKIDQINIHNASLLAMQKSILELSIKPTKIKVDGKFLPKTNFPAEAFVGGDSFIDEISAASIIAKVYRDDLMKSYDLIYPEYEFGKHKGYPTKIHLDALQKFGPTKIHRRTFKGVINND